MAKSLRMISLTTLARQFWHDNRLRLHFADIFYQDLHNKRLLTSVAIAYGLKVKSMGLPPCLEDEFKLALLEMGKRKYAKERARVLQELPVEPPCRAQALQEFIPKYFLQAEINVLALQEYFPSGLIAKVFNFLFALILTNPRDDPSPIRECWTSREFLPYQSVFIDNFETIWDDIFTGLLKKRLLQSNDWKEQYAIGLLKHRTNKESFRCLTVDNETIPWFVFEVLSEEQRGKFLALGRSSVMECRIFRTFFSSIFKHWPWQNEAFDRYFAGREKFSHNEILVLYNVKMYIHGAEDEAIKAGMLPKKTSFIHRIDNFLDGFKIKK